MISQPNYKQLKRYVKYCEAKHVPVGDQRCLEQFLFHNLRPDLLIAVARVVFVPEFFVYKGCTFRLPPNGGLADGEQGLVRAYESSKQEYHQKYKDKEDPEQALRELEIFANWYCTGGYGLEWKLDEQNHRFLGECIAAAWRGALLTQFPDEKFVVELWWDGPGGYDWELTFYHASPHPGLKWWLEE